jgi:prevent-host-death family protein
MKITVSDFRSNYTRYIKSLGEGREPIELVSRGRTVAVVMPPPKKPKINPAWGALAGTVTYISEDFDEPMSEEDWEACR